jgi:branched-chain amino acid transport system substrate-binding protein
MISAIPNKRSLPPRSWFGDGVVFVAGHHCSGASIPASKVYEAYYLIDLLPILFRRYPQ